MKDFRGEFVHPNAYSFPNGLAGSPKLLPSLSLRVALITRICHRPLAPLRETVLRVRNDHADLHELEAHPSHF